MSPGNHDAQRSDDDSARQTVLSARRSFRSDASGEFEEGSNQNCLRDRDIKHIPKSFHAYADVERYARVVPLAEVGRNDWNLNISRYVDTSEAEDGIEVAEAVRNLRVLEKGRGLTETTMNQYLAELGHGG